MGNPMGNGWPGKRPLHGKGFHQAPLWLLANEMGLPPQGLRSTGLEGHEPGPRAPFGYA